MRKALWTIPVLLLFAAIAAPCAYADSYTINFTCSSNPSCILPTSGSFGYNPTTQTFTTDVLVVWDGDNFDITPVLTEDIGNPSASTPCYGSATGAALVFELLATCGPASIGSNWVGNTNPVVFTFQDYGPVSAYLLSSGESQSGELPGAYSTGTWTVTDVTTPEPSAAVLLLTVIGLLLVVLRKRIAVGLPRAS